MGAMVYSIFWVMQDIYIYIYIYIYISSSSSSTVFVMLVVWISEPVSQGFRAFRALGFEVLCLSPPGELGLLVVCLNSISPKSKKLNPKVYMA